MSKEKTVLINMRIPESILAEFDEVVAKDNLVASRTAKVITLMHAEIMKVKRAKK